PYYTLSLHDALPISPRRSSSNRNPIPSGPPMPAVSRSLPPRPPPTRSPSPAPLATPNRSPWSSPFADGPIRGSAGEGRPLLADLARAIFLSRLLAASFPALTSSHLRPRELISYCDIFARRG